MKQNAVNSNTEVNRFNFLWCYELCTLWRSKGSTYFYPKGTVYTVTYFFFSPSNFCTKSKHFIIYKSAWFSKCFEVYIKLAWTF